ncbi:MAG TPA: calcium-binding protein [Solirubrobacteraceae bacterium]
MGKTFAAAAVVAAFAPATAQAATVAASDTGAMRTIVYTAAASETNQPTFTHEGANVVVRDPTAAALTPTAPCVAVDAHTVACPDGAPTITTLHVTASLDDLADTATVNFVVATNLSGGAGKDTITGSDGGADSIDGQADEDTLNGRGGNDSIVDSIDDGAPNHLFGGLGDDFLNGSSGNDDLHGEAGNDNLVGDFGADLLDGGAGFDTANYHDRGTDAAGGVSVTLSGGAAANAGAPGENDTLTGIEDVAGTGRNDALVGDAGPNVLQGFEGDDSITGGPGGDILYGGEGNDSLNAVDQGSDRVECGGQAADAASADTVDQVSGCASLSLVAVPYTGPDVSPPKIGVTYTKTMKLRTFRRKGIAFTVFSSDKTVQDTLTAEMLGRVRSVKSFSKAAVGDLLLAKRSMRFTGRARIRLKPSKRYRAHLRRGQRIRLRVTVNDPSRNRAVKLVTIRLK